MLRRRALLVVPASDNELNGGDEVITILGAGGVIAKELVRELSHDKQRIRLVGRKPAADSRAAEIVAADISDLDQTARAVEGSSVVHLLVGLTYGIAVWRELWPRIMSNAIEACKRANARLVFFDNVYMYGRVNGPMTEETPFNPCSQKGEIRARVATLLLDEIKAGGITAMIARAADFYGPAARTSVANMLVCEKFVKKSRAMWLVNDAVPHSFTFTPDAARGLVLLARDENAWNQTWHLPTAPDPPTGKEFIDLAAREFKLAPRYFVAGRPMLKVFGWFDHTVAESYEMLYQSDSPYLFDSAKFVRAFHFQPTSYAEGVRLTAASYR
jgi:nucleoside-diphosphate-sugar epimerase